MMLGLCRSCLRVRWSNILTYRIDRNTLKYLEFMLSLQSKDHLSRYSRGFLAFSRSNYNKDLLLPTLESAVPDLDKELRVDEDVNDCDDDDLDYYTEDSYYPIQLEDLNRNELRKSHLRNLIKPTAELKPPPSSKRKTSDGRSTSDLQSVEALDSASFAKTVVGDCEITEKLTGYTTLDIDSMTKTKLNHEELKRRNEAISSLIEIRLRERLNPQCSVGVFGSAINGLWTDASDLDICVQIPNVTSRSATIRNLRRIAFLLEPLIPDRIFENRFTAKIPILHWKKGKGKRPLGETVIDSSDCSIDISVNNVLALSNSALIGTYVACDPRVKAMVLALKLWARTRDLNDRSKGTFGSFALSLMVIHFLQRCNPPVLVSLQDLAVTDNEPPTYVSGIDVRFTKDMHRIKEELNYVSKGVENTMTTLQLIQEFFCYFGWTYTKTPHIPIAIRSVDLQFMAYNDNHIAKASTFDMEERFIHVDNPFEVGIDVANISFHQRNRIIKEFRRAYKLLKAGGTLSDVIYS